MSLPEVAELLGIIAEIKDPEVRVATRLRAGLLIANLDGPYDRHRLMDALTRRYGIKSPLLLRANSLIGHLKYVWMGGLSTDSKLYAARYYAMVWILSGIVTEDGLAEVHSID